MIRCLLDNTEVFLNKANIIFSDENTIIELSTYKEDIEVINNFSSLTLYVKDQEIKHSFLNPCVLISKVFSINRYELENKEYSYTYKEQ